MHILYHANIITQDPTNPQVTALAIDQGKIIAVGSSEQLLAECSAKDLKTDLGGKTVWPGLTDSHLHLENYARALQYIDCETDSKEECLLRVAERARTQPEGTWILGHGWNQNVWEAGYGTASDLDKAAPNHPVYLTTKSLHAAWANSRALELAHITPSSPDPKDGVIQRDNDGKLTGILFESAMEIVPQVIPASSPEALVDAIDAAQHALWKLGLTGVHDYDPKTCFVALETLDLHGRLRLRVVKGIPLDLLPHAIGLGLHTGFGSNYLRMGSVKLFADGALGPQTAAMLQPYEGSMDNIGSLFLDREQVFETGQQAVENGISVAIHAIGDHANHEILAGYAQLRQYEKMRHLPHLRHRIEHVQLLHHDDLNGLAKLDIIASVQPIHATSDMHIADRYWGKRAENAYAFRTILNSGAHLTFGSDAPVESPNPFLGIHAAVTRRRTDGTPGQDGWYPQQRLTLQEALDGYTTGPAFAAGCEDHWGRLVPGFVADLIVLSQDPYKIEAQDLFQLKPEATMVAGEWVFQA
jgi:predicted amidohydrolase YtcJ